MSSCIRSSSIWSCDLRIAYIVATLAVCSACTVSVARADKTTTVSASTVQRYDGGMGVPDCNSAGTGCTVMIVKTVATNSTITSIGGGFVLRVEHTYMYGGLSLPSESIAVENRSIVFPSTTTVTIDDSPSYPFLNGRIIDISGITTDVNGGYSVSFLP